MTNQENLLLSVSSAPHLRGKETTRGLMRDVIIALVPTTLAGTYFFGLRSLLVVAVGIIAAVLGEALCQKIMGKKIAIKDLSAVVTGLLVALNCPVTMPLWQVAFGSVFAVVIVKEFFGGIGSNFMNPALGARAVMMISFGKDITNFTKPLSDMVSTATPLSQNPKVAPEALDMFLGNMPGVIGEVSKLALLIGAAYLVIRKVISLEIPLVYIGSTLLTVFAFSKGEADLVYHLLTGGLIMGAFFMATDYATAPITKKGKIIFAVGCGFLTGVIRLFGGNPEGVCYSIIIMNMFVPLIDKFTKRRVYGTGGRA